jgi:hypothetical protein
MQPLTVKKNVRTDEFYAQAKGLVTLLSKDRFPELNDPKVRQAHDWLLWALQVEDPPFPESSSGRLEVGLEPGEPDATVMIAYIWDLKEGLFLRLKDIRIMIDRKRQQFLEQCQDAGVDPDTHVEPFAFLKRRIDQIQHECETDPGDIQGWDGA